jgi:8-oxo-dGTP pyrophosphatase MutT (NUDIX family)
MPKIKSSIGLALCKIVNNKFSVLMVKKRVSYAFVEFVNGKYTIQSLRKLLNSTTFQEKIIIRSLNFKFMWHHLWYHLQEDNTSKFAQIIQRTYQGLCDKFDNLIRADGGAHLRKLLDSSNSIENIWEIPKGRRDNNEKSLDTAMREFYEETSIKPSDYRIVWTNPVANAYDDLGTTYSSLYYIALCDKDKHKNVCLDICNSEQKYEIENIKWINEDLIDLMRMDKITTDRTRNIFNQIRKRIPIKYLQ